MCRVRDLRKPKIWLLTITIKLNWTERFSGKQKIKLHFTHLTPKWKLYMYKTPFLCCSQIKYKIVQYFLEYCYNFPTLKPIIVISVRHTHNRITIISYFFFFLYNISTCQITILESICNSPSYNKKQCLIIIGANLFNLLGFHWGLSMKCGRDNVHENFR